MKHQEFQAHKSFVIPDTRMAVRSSLRVAMWLVVVLVLLTSSIAHAGKPQDHAKSRNKPNDYSEFVGRYGRGETDIVYVKIRDGKLTVRPIFWHSAQAVDVNNDSFVVTDRKDRGGSFVRGAGGEVAAVWIVGLSNAPVMYEKVNRSGKLPLELLFDGRGKESYKGLSKHSGYGELMSAARMFFEHFPSRSVVAVKFLEEFAKQFKDSADVHTLLGRAYVAAHMRANAVEAFRKALILSAGSKDAEDYLLRLHAAVVPPEVDSAEWKLPFSLDDLFRKPTSAEMKKVRQMWGARDLSPVEPKEVVQATVKFDSVEMTVRIVSHRVQGSLHYGAILVPAKAGKRSCAVVLEAKGVSWDYFPLDVNTGLNAPSILGKDLSHTVIVVPSFRGEKLILNSQVFLSEGDRTDNWDGATDDALVLLNVALRTTPEADSTRIYAFGRSRGGSVAMLAAERDKRIRRVVEWAGPVDWFELMGEEGWTQRELVEEGLRIHAKPNETAGQFIERFLLKGVGGTRNLEETRLKMIASSPLYFATSLPALQLHHGVEDYNVPIANASALVTALNKQGRSTQSVEHYFYEGFGHDTDVPVATERSHRFLTEKTVTGHKVRR